MPDGAFLAPAVAAPPHRGAVDVGAGPFKEAPMSKAIRFGVTLPQMKRTWPEAKAAAMDIDAAGYDSAWVCDHLYGVPMPNVVGWPGTAATSSSWSDLIFPRMCW